MKQGISVDELNKCYCEVNSIFKRNGFPTREEIEYNLVRISDETKTIIPLKFKQEPIGIKGSYVFISRNVYVIGIESEN